MRYDQRGRPARFLARAAVYLALSALWIYGILDRGLHEGSEARGWAILALVALAHVPFGYASREWPALLLPIAVVLLAIPAGYPESRYGEPAPLWFGQILLVQVEIPLLAAGLALRSLREGRRGRAARA
ncbi:MAG TPA: hypothetical protein VD704_12575 [Gaiellaceae bacterium]|nr:hypothetical protein [Gaiellaceae bacterium]